MPISRKEIRKKGPNKGQDQNHRTIPEMFSLRNMINEILENNLNAFGVIDHRARNVKRGSRCPSFFSSFPSLHSFMRLFLPLNTRIHLLLIYIIIFLSFQILKHPPAEKRVGEELCPTSFALTAPVEVRRSLEDVT